MSGKIYIIGDVHGCYKTLCALIKRLPKNARICFVGDLCDRGNSSKEVIEFVKLNDYDCVLGNHESFYIEGVENILEASRIDENTTYWLNRCGGEKTIESYKKDGILDEITLKVHLNWISQLPLYKEYKDIKTEDGRYLVVSHSHIYNKWEYRNSHENSIEYSDFTNTVLFSRYKNCDNEEIFNVFGHTPTSTPIMEKHKASIDLGCIYTNDESLENRLCALEFPTMKVITQENIE